MAYMKLLRFKVTKFRSIIDSGWIDCDDVTTLIGINEAGKSNVLLALWKLCPAVGGEIDLLTDMPRHLYSSLRDKGENIFFIEAEFKISSNLARELEEITDASSEEVYIVNVRRSYDGQYSIGFPLECDPPISICSSNISSIVKDSLLKVQGLKEVGKGEEGIKKQALKAITETEKIVSKDDISKDDIESILRQLSVVKSTLKTSKIEPVVKNILRVAEEDLSLFNKQKIEVSENDEVADIILDNLPRFVYYANYGNLDSEIYLPHVIDNLKRNDISGIAAAKARTLKVLFEFVKLDPQEILDLGHEPELKANEQGVKVRLTEEQIKTSAAKKTERDVLLQSASSKLTSEFRHWWKQGNYKFRFSADGSHFRIWVSDDQRPDEIELESRSTGLQWFLSFYLVFLVESKEEHRDAILLLDEAGLSLHPLAQEDLIDFFDSLSEKNQILHTAHSPFLVDTSHVDRVKVVYVNNEGYTEASNDLRAGESNSAQTKSIYAVHAALGLSVSDILLQGCHVVIVEGTSDQYYLTAIKNYLIGEGIINPKREIVFACSGGVRGVPGIASILSCKEEDLPPVILDSDNPGQNFKDKLLKNLYKDNIELVHEIKDINNLENSEIEDLIPFDILARTIDKLFRNIDDVYFEDEYNENLPIIPQIKSFSSRNNINLPKGWKVDIARQTKQFIINKKNLKIDEKYLEFWKLLFEKISSD